MKIYTKTGDDGTTALFGGKRLSKSDLRIDSYGTVDELNSHVGLLKDQSANAEDKAFLLEIQDKLFTLGSILASNPEKKRPKSIPDIVQADIEKLEKEIDTINEILEPLQYFILPGGHVNISQSHIARCVCRRTERICVALSQVEDVDSLIIKYLNRLSDYLFTYSRKLAKLLSIDEVKWEAKL
ncbi:MAG: cob(I)alamin adenosyltransferase [Planctomycetota bacterium]|jgi:cob(I)alamin adenosyltransferase